MLMGIADVSGLKPDLTVHPALSRLPDLGQASPSHRSSCDLWLRLCSPSPGRERPSFSFASPAPV